MKKLIKSKGMNYNFLAPKLGLTRQGFENLLKNTGNFRLKHLAKLSELLNVSIMELVNSTK